MHFLKKIGFLLALALMIGAGCSNNPSNTPSGSEDGNTDIIQNQRVSESVPKNETDITIDTEDASPRYTMEEVAQHSTHEDCWFVINDRVYDVSTYSPRHPGGDTIYEGCGKDATELFYTRPMGSGTPHSEKAQNYMQNLEIGTLAK